MQILEALHRAIRTIPNFPKPGIQFKDITPLLGNAVLLDGAIRLLAEPFAGQGIAKIVAVESRGFVLGPALAQQIGAGFVLVRKRGKLPYDTLKVAYGLEYGTDEIEMHVDALQAGERVLIHDDVIATGGTASACHRLVEQAGAVVAGFSFLVELAALNGRTALPVRTPVHALLTEH